MQYLLTLTLVGELVGCFVVGEFVAGFVGEGDGAIQNNIQFVHIDDETIRMINILILPLVLLSHSPIELLRVDKRTLAIPCQQSMR